MNMIRFSAYDGSFLVAQTGWTPEHDRDSAPNLLAEFRKSYGGLAYQIERTGDSKIPNPIKLTRATIRDKEETYYSRWFLEAEVEERMKEIRVKWPNADITTETRNG